MPKLKTFVTQAGFFELAIAAPSMKAAIEALGIPLQSFKKGFAKQTTDAAVVAATSAKPGIVLKRAVGSKGKFTEHAALPKLKAEKTTAEDKPGTGANKKAVVEDKKDALKRKKLAADRRRAMARFTRAQRRHATVLAKLDKEASGLANKRALEEDQWAKEKQRFSNIENAD